MAKMRARIMSASVRVIRAGSRRSRKQRANRSATPRRRSAIDSNMTPPSEVRRPPSKSAVTFLRATDGNENGRAVSSIMAGVAGQLCAKGWLRYPNPTSLQSLKLRPSASNAGSVNKSGYLPGSLKKGRLERRPYVHKRVPMKHAVDHLVSDFLELIGRGLSGAAVLLDLVAYLLTLLQIAQAGALDGADVNENIRSAIIGLDEAKALLTVEPFHSSVSHVILQAKLEEGPIRGPDRSMFGRSRQRLRFQSKSKSSGRKSMRDI